MKNRLTRFTAAASLAMVSALTATNLLGGGVEPTEATWTDTEVAKASVQAQWATNYFARVAQPSTKLKWTDRFDSGSWPDNPRELTKTYQISTVAGTDVANPAPVTRAPGEYRHTSTAFSPYTVDATIVQNPRNTSNRIWHGNTTNSNITNARYCLAANPIATSNLCSYDPNVNPQAANDKARVEASQDTADFTLSLSSELTTKKARVNARNFSTSVRCFDDGRAPTATIGRPGVTPILQLARENNLGGAEGGNYSNEITVTTMPTSDNPTRLDDGWGNWFRHNIRGGTDYSYVLLIQPRRNTYVQTNPPYAVAEVMATVQIYSAGGLSSSNAYYVDSMSVVLSRSECGTALYQQAPSARQGLHVGDTNQTSWPAPLWPSLPKNSNGDPANRVPNGSSGPLDFGATASRMALRSAPQPEATETTTVTSTPPATTTTSPLENSTATVTTTSAPPEATEEGAAESTTESATQTVTSTSVPETATETVTTVAPVIPSEPGDLTESEPTRLAGNVNVVEDGGDPTLTDAFVKGIDIPDDAGAGARALDTWFSTGLESGDWKVFTSDDPDADGWRWATINQETGTVVYIR